MCTILSQPAEEAGGVLQQLAVLLKGRSVSAVPPEGGRRRQKLLLSIKDIHMNASVRNK